MGRAVFHGSSGIDFVDAGEVRRVHDKEGVTAIPGKIFGGGLNIKNLPGAITASPQSVQLLRTLLSSHAWPRSQRISAPSTLVSGKLQIKYRNKNTFLWSFQLDRDLACGIIHFSGEDGEENPELKHSLLTPVQDKDVESHMERLFPFGITGVSAPMYFLTLQKS